MLTMIVTLMTVLGMVMTTDSQGSHGTIGHGDQGRDDDAERTFGKAFYVFTILCGIVLAVVILAGIASLFGAFTRDEIDPPV